MVAAKSPPMDGPMREVGLNHTFGDSIEHGGYKSVTKQAQPSPKEFGNHPIVDSEAIFASNSRELSAGTPRDVPVRNSSRVKSLNHSSR